MIMSILQDDNNNEMRNIQHTIKRIIDKLHITYGANDKSLYIMNIYMYTKKYTDT